MKIEVRKLQNTDIEELSRIEAASFSMPWLAEDFRGLLTRDYCLYVVAEADGHIAGCAGLTDSFHEGNIDNVVTAPEYRNLGIGGKMLRPSTCMRNSVLSPRGSARNFMKNRQRMP